MTADSPAVDNRQERSGTSTSTCTSTGTGSTHPLARAATLKHSSPKRPSLINTRESSQGQGHRRRRSSLSSAPVAPSITISTSNTLPSPVGDFQSDNVLNQGLGTPAPISLSGSASAAFPISPISGPVRHVGLPGPGGSPIPVLEKLRLEEDEAAGDGVSHTYNYDARGGANSNGLLVGVGGGHGYGNVTGNGNGNGNISPGLIDWNPFLPPGLENWTRESWGRRKVALISGITGQDGSYLAELLLSKGYTVHGIIRRSSSFNTGRLHHLYEDAHSHSVDGTPRLKLHYGDLTDSTNLVYILSRVQPSEVYNLGAQSHVKVSFEMAEYTGDVDGLGALRLLDAIRTCGLEKLVKFYQASTSELYGQVATTPQNEKTPFHPRSPYGVAKLYAYWIVVNYREAYGMFACNGILFNHESPRRGRTFVTRKITRAVAEISLGKQDCVYMGNIDAKRDWGHARDYVDGMWRVLQHHTAEDFVLASNETHSVREFIEKSFAVVGTTISWYGKDEQEVGVDQKGRVLVRVDPRYYRPAEVELLHGDCTKAEQELGWKRSVDFDELVQEMVLADLASAKRLLDDHN